MLRLVTDCRVYTPDSASSNPVNTLTMCLIKFSFWAKVLCLFVLGATTAVLLFVNMACSLSIISSLSCQPGATQRYLFLVCVCVFFSFSVLGRTTRDSGLGYPVYGSVSAPPPRDVCIQQCCLTPDFASSGDGRHAGGLEYTYNRLTVDFQCARRPVSPRSEYLSFQRGIHNGTLRL